MALGDKTKEARRARSAGFVEAEGPKLRLSANNQTGYLHVSEKASERGPRFLAFIKRERLALGTYDTATGAAVAIARHLQAQGKQEAEEEEAEEEEAEEEEEGEEEVGSVDGADAAIFLKAAAGPNIPLPPGAVTDTSVEVAPPHVRVVLSSSRRSVRNT